MSRPRPAQPSILVFLHSFEPGGVERVALRLAGAWAEAGAEVTVAMGRRGGPLAAEAPKGVGWAFARPFAFARHCESLWLVPHLVREVRRRRPDVLFCAGNTYAVVAVLARLILGRACPPIVCKVSNPLVRPDFGWPMRDFYRLWLRLQARFLDRFVALTEAMGPEAASALGLPRTRVAVIADPALRLADIPRRTAPRPARAGGGRLFVAVGRLAPQKDFALLLEAFALARRPGDRLVIFGEGRERRRLTRVARQLRIAEQVELPGHVDQVAAWLARADALVLSSRYEGAPAVVIEALAQGAPVAATDCSAGLREILDGEAFGVLAPLGDPRALAEAMDQAAARRFDVVAMRAQAAAFTVERAAPRYLALFAELAVARRASLVPSLTATPPPHRLGA